MEGIPVFCKDELEKMGKDALIGAYLSLKDRFLEQIAVDAKKDRLIKTLSERLNLHNAKQFGKSTETSVSLSGSHSAGRRTFSRVKDHRFRICRRKQKTR